jgi:hypothetical protein
MAAGFNKNERSSAGFGFSSGSKSRSLLASIDNAVDPKNAGLPGFPLVKFQFPFLSAQALHRVQIIVGIDIPCTAAASICIETPAIHIFQDQASGSAAAQACRATL